jgi:hypothetical protein
MGKKRRYRRNPQKFGRKYGLKYGLNKADVEPIAEAPQQEKIILAAIEPVIEAPIRTIAADPVIEKVVIKDDPVVKAVKKTTRRKPAPKRAKAATDGSKSATPARKTRRKRSVAVKTTS